MGPVDLPPGLLEFQLTLRPPAGMSAVEVLKDADAYSNQDPPATGPVHIGVPMREAGGWRLGADVHVPAVAAAVLAMGTAGAVAGVRAALLFYGIFDFHRALPALSALIGGPGAESQTHLEPADVDARRDDPALSPEVRCAHFPPTLLLVGGRDPLLPESVAMAKRLSEHGVAHELAVVPGAPHGFCSCRPIRRTPRSSRRSTTSCTSAA